MRTRRKRAHTNAKCYVFHEKGIIYSCVLFEYIGNIDETVHRQHLNQYINIYLIENIVKTSFIRYFIATTENLIFTGDFFLFFCSW